MPTLHSNEEFNLETANRIYLQKGFKPKKLYREILKYDFLATAVEMDFSKSQRAVDKINNWVEKVTHHKIQGLLNRKMIRADTKMVLINAIYFRGTWKTKFDRDQTKKKDFLTESGHNVKVPTMHLKEKKDIAVLKQLKIKVLRLPYEGERIVMDIVLPDDKGGLKAVEEKLRTVDLKDLLEESLYEQEVEVDLPKFKIDTTWKQLKGILQSLGITDIFHGGLEGIADGGLSLSEVIQKATIEVDEAGSEAAAATGGLTMFKSANLDNDVLSFKADHPFLFSLRDIKTGLLLFRGRVSDPSK